MCVLAEVSRLVLQGKARYNLGGLPFVLLCYCSKNIYILLTMRRRKRIYKPVMLAFH